MPINFFEIKIYKDNDSELPAQGINPVIVPLIQIINKHANIVGVNQFSDRTADQCNRAKNEIDSAHFACIS